MRSRGFEYGAALIALLSAALVVLGIVARHQSYGLSLCILGAAALCAVGLVKLVRVQAKLDKLEAEIKTSSLFGLYRRTRQGKDKR